jgi:hypothetical protein
MSLEQNFVECSRKKKNLDFFLGISMLLSICAHCLSENLPDYKKKVTIEKIIFHSVMQFKFVSYGFIFNAYCKNELHDMKNESNELNE